VKVDEHVSASLRVKIEDYLWIRNIVAKHNSDEDYKEAVRAMSSLEAQFDEEDDGRLSSDTTLQILQRCLVLALIRLDERVLYCVWPPIFAKVM